MAMAWPRLCQGYADGEETVIWNRREMAIIKLRGEEPGEASRAVNHPDVPDDYSVLPDYRDERARTWRHADAQAWEPPDRKYPVYDLA